MKTSDFATGYGISAIAAVAGASVSIRQILLHIFPPDPGYDEPVLGLHLYTWALSVFVAVIIASGINRIFARARTPRGQIQPVFAHRTLAVRRDHHRKRAHGLCHSGTDLDPA